eukprot:GEMP01020197.1.p1 GENE.GEMP01020197.1~~GEMP01020197.1.p1  ORF type:complete len:768 (+),score=160.82 GEMP01020197.1:35-2338(+)
MFGGGENTHTEKKTKLFLFQRMELACHQVDYLQLPCSLSKNTLCVLPLGKKKQQKVAVGDDHGVLTVFYMKKGETVVEWKSPALGREITKVRLQSGKDKIFVASGQSIHGFTRKGKEFLKIKTNLTETIHKLFVDEAIIWAGGEYMMNIYIDCKDAGFVLCQDRINDLTCCRVLPGELCSVLALQDKCIRVYQREKCIHEHAMDSSCTTLSFHDPEEVQDRAPGSQKETSVIYGTENGHLGILSLSAQGIRQVFQLPMEKRQPSVVRAISADMSKSGSKELCLAREDGSLEIWDLGDNTAFASPGQSYNQPVLIYETRLPETIRAMDCGTVTGEMTDLIITTYGGKVLGITADPAAQDATGAGMCHDVDEGATRRQKATDKEKTKHHDKRFNVLALEVEKLKEKVDREKEKYAQVSGNIIAINPVTNVSHQFRLSVEEACYVLTVEAQSPLEFVSLRSDVKVDLLQHESEGSGAILSRSSDGQNSLLATYRIQQQNASRLRINLRTLEGTQGVISCYIVPYMEPKTAHLINLHVKPLSLHEKVRPADIPEEQLNDVANELRINGPFSLNDIHQWFSLCVNELPERPHEDDMFICYQSTFLKTYLTAKYSQKTAVFRSDSATSIFVIKDVVSREATARKIQLQISADINDQTFANVLCLIDPKLVFQSLLTQQVQLVEPLKEIQLQEDNVDFLAPDLTQILANAVEIEQQYKMQPQRLKFLQNIIVNLYTHKWRLKGYQSIDHRIPALQQILNNYSLEALTTFFDEAV